MPDQINRTRGTYEKDHRRKKVFCRQQQKVDGRSKIIQQNALIEPLDEAIALATEKVVVRKLLTANGEKPVLTERQKAKNAKKIKLVKSVRPGRVGKNCTVSMPVQLSKKKVKQLLQAAKFRLQDQNAKKAAAESVVDNLAMDGHF
ncbi:hypothetical protein RTP6_001921 [Batrachochytrium dendrobatidis]